MIPAQGRLAVVTGVFDGWVMAELLVHSVQSRLAELPWDSRACVRNWLPERMIQFAHNWYLPCYQCTETCSHVSSIQNDIDTYPEKDYSVQVQSMMGANNRVHHGLKGAFFSLNIALVIMILKTYLKALNI